ncbi:MAG: hypothetical protein C0169_04990, partial [Thermodesulfobacterium geofontis]
LGLIEFELGNLEEAEKCYRKALELNENFAEAWINLSTVLIEKGLFEEAIKALEKAKVYAPENAVIYNNLAVAYYYLKDKESALKNLNLAKEL